MRLAWSVLAFAAWQALPASPAWADDRARCGEAYERAQRTRIAGHPSEARAELLVCVRDVCPAFIRSDCVTWLAEVSTEQPTIVLAAIDGSGRDIAEGDIELDGKPVDLALQGAEVPLDPGAHVVRLRARGREIVEQITVRVGEKARRVELRLTSPPSATVHTRPLSSSFVASASASVVLLATGAVFWLIGSGSARRYNDRCVLSGCSDDDRSTVQRELVAGDVLVSAGVVAGALAVFFFLTRPTRVAR